MPLPHSFISSFPKVTFIKYVLHTRHMLRIRGMVVKGKDPSLCPTLWPWLNHVTFLNLCSPSCSVGVGRLSKVLFSSISYGFIAPFFSINSETEDYVCAHPKTNTHNLGKKIKERGMNSEVSGTKVCPESPPASLRTNAAIVMTFPVNDLINIFTTLSWNPSHYWVKLKENEIISCYLVSG